MKTSHNFLRSLSALSLAVAMVCTANTASSAVSNHVPTTPQESRLAGLTAIEHLYQAMNKMRKDTLLSDDDTPSPTDSSDDPDTTDPTIETADRPLISRENPAQTMLDIYKPVKVNRPNYVAIGDSWSGSSLLPTMRPDVCLRNWTSFPEMVTVATQLSERNTSCAGATLNSYWKWSKFIGKKGESGSLYKSPSRNAINENTELVTIQLGMNDFQSFFCLLTLNKPRCVRDMDRYFSYIRPYLKPVYASFYRDALIRSRNNATVVAVGYPRLFQSDRPCWDAVVINRAVRANIDRFTLEINEAARAAAEEIGVGFVLPDAKLLPKLRTSCGIPFYRYTAGVDIVEGSEMYHATMLFHAKVAHEVLQEFKDED